MTTKVPVHDGQKQITDLTLREVDMIYSLSRVGWTDPEISRRYRISRADVRTVIDRYEELRKTAEDNPPHVPSTVTAKQGRKVGRNARYGSNRERQAAYRARLREKHRAEMQSPDPAVDSPAPTEEEPSLPQIDATLDEIDSEKHRSFTSALVTPMKTITLP